MSMADLTDHPAINHSLRPPGAGAIEPAKRIAHSSPAKEEPVCAHAGGTC